MVRIEQLAEAAINQDALSLRSLTQDLLRECPKLRDFPRPMRVDFTTLAASAALIELFAERLHQEPPAKLAALWPANDDADALMNFVLSERRARLQLD